MDFDFLPKLPKSDLDDRTYKDLVDECILRIPRYCPEWSNFNPSDPGITLIELFAWLTDQMQLRFNQVPRRNYVAFLELLGIRLQAATPAKTEITFYLSRPQSQDEPIPAILSGTEVATERTETEEAFIFSTDHLLEIGLPRIRHYLTAETTEKMPVALRDRFSNLWTQDNTTGRWSGPEQPVFEPYPQTGNCFYLVFDSSAPLDGNVIVLDIEGEPAGSTGINPDQPPRRWEAWDETGWQPILIAEADDGSRGFSFSEGNQDTTDIKQATIRLHMPLRWPDVTFGRYRGRWLRCTYTELDTAQTGQTGYNRSPKLAAISAYAIGGTTEASQCMLIQDELIGESNGKPGQTMPLLSGAILPRTDGEHLLVAPPGELPQTWQEVTDFADSGPEDRHYTLDSLTGEIQFGPLIREPSKLAAEVEARRQIQENGNVPEDLSTLDLLEWQHGAVPPRGSTIRMAAYRTGGGADGNVKSQTIRTLKSAVPYVTQVVNLKPALNGADAESLDEAVIRVPSLLRTRDRAITTEDFEVLTLQSTRAVARAYCPNTQTGGQIRVFVVPQASPLSDTTGSTADIGISPHQLQLTNDLQLTIRNFLDDRRILGIEVLIDTPTYVGVSVQAKIGIAAENDSAQARAKIEQAARSRLYEFLNPVTGGADGEGWKFGTPVYKSDIIGQLQSVPGVQYLGPIELFSLRRIGGQIEGQIGGEWVRSLATEGIVRPGTLGLICSWADPNIQSGHSISLESLSIVS